MSAYEISIVSVVGINVILAVSLNMISGFCGQISLGHGAFFGAGAYAAALAMVGVGSVALAICVAIVAASLLGIVVGFASLRVRTDFLAVTTIGVNFLFIGFVRKQDEPSQLFENVTAITQADLPEIGLVVEPSSG